MKPLYFFSAIRLTSSNHLEEVVELIFIAGSGHRTSLIHRPHSSGRQAEANLRDTLGICEFSPHLLMVLACTKICPRRAERRTVVRSARFSFSFVSRSNTPGVPSPKNPNFNDHKLHEQPILLMSSMPCSSPLPRDPTLFSPGCSLDPCRALAW